MGVASVRFVLHDLWLPHADKANSSAEVIRAYPTIANWDASAEPGLSVSMDSIDNTTFVPRSNSNELKADFAESHSLLDSLDAYMKPRMWHPNSLSRGCWDVMGIALLICDVVMIPMEFFEAEHTVASEMVNWTARLFWTLDVFGSFATGYTNKNGAVELRFTMTAKRYAKTWLVVDLSLAVVDWLSFVIRDLTWVGSGRVLRIARFVRLMRLARLYRLVMLAPAILQSMSYVIEMESGKMVVQILGIMLLSTGLIHLIACLWYEVGTQSASRGVGWLVNHDIIQEDPLAYRYAMSYHWGLTQLAGTTNINPDGTSERWFAICVLMLCFVVSALVISSITTVLTNLLIVNSKLTRDRFRLEQYLRHHNVPILFAQRVQKCAAISAAEQKKHIQEHEVDLLAVLSEPMMVELHYRINGPLIEQHPLMEPYAFTVPLAMRRVCHSAISEQRVQRKDVIFTIGEKPLRAKMYFILSGNLGYNHCFGGFDDFVLQAENDRVAEAALWTPWEHCGNMCGMTFCTLVTLNTDDFVSVTSEFAVILRLVVKYGQAFVEALAQIEDTKRLTDLESQHMVDVNALAQDVFSGRSSQSSWSRTSMFHRARSRSR